MPEAIKIPAVDPVVKLELPAGTVPPVTPTVLVDVAKAPVVEEEGGEVNLGSFLSAKGIEQPTEPVVKKEEGEKVVEKQKDEPRKTLAQEKQEAERVKASGKAAAVARDYSDVDESDVPLFKTMSNDSFNKLKPLYVEHKAIKAQLATKDNEIATLKQQGTSTLPASYYEHPQGFALSPEYHAAATEAQTAEQIFTHWQNQLINIRQGKDWEDLDMNAQGKLVVGKPAPATAEAEVLINKYLIGAQNQYMQSNSKVSGVQQAFTQRHKADVAVLEDADKTVFKDLQDNKSPLWPIFESVLKEIPQSFQHTPMARLLAKSTALNLYLTKEVQKLKGGAQTAEQIAASKLADAAKAGPSSKEINNGAGISGNSDVTFEAFQAAKRG